ncbi:LuxR C-terminal-related transcriptional regulator [Polyangium sp. y55x31]|uniref:helix-turn-helix transcriptional regulator n=1 Tax=Polyangium sp. y55x31 TaxID=3042688 RepID=UPI00248310A0|nr:LuxR C-terminal-related transcriptional regulator [Polyangium sp. y55x31]MDI1481834.1 LuxR C-terminal-related transcriptional regulator [Polyangium sp. y55x31]
MSEFLTWRDARAVFRVLDELKQLRHDTLSWRRHMVRELGALVGAHVGVAGEAPAGRFLDPSSHVGTIDTGWASESDRIAWMSVCSRIEPDLDPSDKAVAALGPRSFTRTRQALATDRDWYRSGIFNDHYKPAGLDHYLLSHREIPGYEVAHYFFLFRARSERPFTERERKLVHHFHQELGRMWREASREALPRRLEQTLLLLQAGCSEKEVAARLDLSPSTVHDYCKSLHKRFNVRSRSELLSHATTLPQAPRLVLEETRHAPARSVPRSVKARGC